MTCRPIVLLRRKIHSTPLEEKLAVHLAELWECHPFRDGNTRTNFLFGFALAKSRGIDYNLSANAIKAYRGAIREYVQLDGDKSLFKALISEFIEPARTKVIEVDPKLDAEISENLPINPNELQLTNPIKRSDYDKAVALLHSEQRKLEKELYPNSTTDPMQEQNERREVLRELKKRLPEATEIKEAYQANHQISELFDQWRALDNAIINAKQLNDDKNVNELMKQKGRLLETLIYRKSLGKQLSSDQKKKIERDYKNIESALSKERSLDRGLGR